jgi:sugar (pentulose or hexulose) kinase
MRKRDPVEQLVCGIDVGTSAVRVLVCTLSGEVRASGTCALAPVRVDGSRREQDADDWWRAVSSALKQAVENVPAATIAAVSVDATSGTFVPVERTLRPLGPGLMYNDGRATGYAERINAAAAGFCERHGYRFKDDFSLAKLLWLQEHDPDFARVHCALHQSDFIVTQLAGEITATDWSNALKSGADLHEARWADFLAKDLGFDISKLPSRIVAPGTVIGTVSSKAAEGTGLAQGTSIVAGASDGTASLFACGAAEAGDFNTALGTTVSIRGIAPALIHDPKGVLYSHRHPDGQWLPGAASNVGCSGLNGEFAPDPARRSAVLEELNRAATPFLPTEVLTYPLGDATTERFPFKKSGIKAFVTGQPRGRGELFAAFLQGIAFVERWCYEDIAALGAPAQRVFSTGGGSRSALWCRVRADVLQKPICLPLQAETAFGAAILAAAHLAGGFAAASRAMARQREVIEPGPAAYEETYHRFREECATRWGV